MRIMLLIAILMSGCQTMTPQQINAMQNYLNYQQREQHHRDYMMQGTRLPMRPMVAPAPYQYQNPYNPMQQQNNPYYTMPGGY